MTRGNSQDLFCHFGARFSTISDLEIQIFQDPLCARFKKQFSLLTHSPAGSQNLSFLPSQPKMSKEPQYTSFLVPATTPCSYCTDHGRSGITHTWEECRSRRYCANCDMKGHQTEECTWNDKSCTICLQKGHVALVCRKKEPARSVPTCNYCRKEGHVIEDCRKRGSKDSPPCGYCGIKGHPEDICRVKKRHLEKDVKQERESRQSSSRMVDYQPSDRQVGDFSRNAGSNSLRTLSRDARSKNSRNGSRERPQNHSRDSRNGARNISPPRHGKESQNDHNSRPFMSTQRSTSPRGNSQLATTKSRKTRWRNLPTSPKSLPKTKNPHSIPIVVKERGQNSQEKDTHVQDQGTHQEDYCTYCQSRSHLRSACRLVPDSQLISQLSTNMPVHLAALVKRENTDESFITEDVQVIDEGAVEPRDVTPCKRPRAEEPREVDDDNIYHSLIHGSPAETNKRIKSSNEDDAQKSPKSIKKRSASKTMHLLPSDHVLQTAANSSHLSELISPDLITPLILPVENPAPSLPAVLPKPTIVPTLFSQLHRTRKSPTKAPLRMSEIGGSSFLVPKPIVTTSVPGPFTLSIDTQTTTELNQKITDLSKTVVELNNQLSALKDTVQKQNEQERTWSRMHAKIQQERRDIIEEHQYSVCSP